METVAVTSNVPVVRRHAHHQVAAAIFVGLLCVSCSVVLAAELVKPARYEFHSMGQSLDSYIIFDRDTGRTTQAAINSKTPIDSLQN